MTLAALVALAPSANAIPLTWVTGPQAGQAFAGGAIQIKATNYDTGSLYPVQPVGTVVSGAATLDALQSRAPLGFVAGQGDSWGILKITEIDARASDGVLRPIFVDSSSSFELTAMFWGVTDFMLTQISPGSALPGGGQIIDGTGLRVDLYSDPSKNFNQTGGPGLAHTVNTYPTVTNGTLELSLLSTPGFINAAGTLGGIATEFESNTANTGYAALNVTGGASAAQFDTNGIGFSGSFGAAFTPGLGATTAADIWFSFTSTQGSDGWDITSNDPMLANIRPGVPDTGSTLLMLGAGLALMGEAYRRRQKA